MSRSLRNLILGLLIAAALIAGGLVWHHKASPYHFLPVAPGVLYRSGTLRPGNLRKVIERHGIRTVVNLRTDAETQVGDWYRHESRIVGELGAELVNLPLQYETPPAKEQIEAWLALLDDEGRLPVLVHCQHGVVRTGMLVAIYEMEYRRKGNRETLDTLPMFGHRLHQPHRKPMRDFILGYGSRWQQGEVMHPASGPSPP
ncbi:tyrosine-protein phosphatase [Planctomycetota bacterium]